VGDEVRQCLERKRENRLARWRIGGKMCRQNEGKGEFVLPKKIEMNAAFGAGGANFRWRIKNGESSIDKRRCYD